MTNLFETSENGQAVVAGVTQQTMATARLTQQATGLAQDALDLALGCGGDEQTRYEQMILASKSDHDSMDLLLSELITLTDVDISYLYECDLDMLDRMIASQQSKRSRSKNAIMTIDNYKVLMAAGIAENLLRIAAGKPKNSAMSGESVIEFSAEALEILANDPDKLGKAIRNLQSKKSNYRKSREFDVSSAKWQSIIKSEGQLKLLRGSDAGTSYAVNVVASLKKVLDGKKPEDLNKDAARQVVADIMSMLSEETGK